MTGQDNHPVQITARTIGAHEVQTVNARELHEYLEVGTKFAMWITERIEQYKFNENEDFVFFPDLGKNPNGGRPSKEYYLSLDMAKELAMVERNAKGREVRKYFIRCEQELKALTVDRLVELMARQEETMALASGLSEEIRVLRNSLTRVEQSIFVDFPIRRFRYDKGFVHVLLVDGAPVILARDFLRVVCGEEVFANWTSKLETLGLIRDKEFKVYPIEKLSSQYGVSPKAIVERLGMAGAHANPVTIVLPLQALRRIRDKHPRFASWYEQTVIPHLSELFAVALKAPSWELG